MNTQSIRKLWAEKEGGAEVGSTGACRRLNGQMWVKEALYVGPHLVHQRQDKERYEFQFDKVQQSSAWALNLF